MNDLATPPNASPRLLPAWARVADVLTLAVAALGLIVAAFGGFRVRVWGVPVSFTSAPRLLALAAVIVVIRHVLVRQDPLYQRAWAGLVRTWHADDVRMVFPIWLASRLGVLLVGFLAVGTFGFRNNVVPVRFFESEALNLPVRYDVGWYLGIAYDGYQYDPTVVGQQNIAFMPALPVLMRVGGWLLGGQPLLAGQAMVLLASFLGFVYVYRLARSALGDGDRASTAVALLAAYPFAVFYSAVYTESLFLLCSAGAFYHLSRRQYWRVAGFALLAGFARPNGFLLAVPLALVEFWPALVEGRRGAGSNVVTRLVRAARVSMPSLAAASAAAIGVIVFSTFIYTLTGRPLAWLEAHAAWGRTFGTWIADGPFQVVRSEGLYGYLFTRPVDALNGVAILSFLAAMWPVTRRFGVAYGAFLAVNVVPPLTAGGLLSIGRVTACMFPVFIWMAGAIPARHRTAWLTLFALLQAWGAALFFTWRDFI